MIHKWEENMQKIQRIGEPNPTTTSNLPWNASEVLRLLGDGEVDSEWGMSKEIGRMLHMASSTVCINLKRLVLEGHVTQIKKGIYRITDDLDREMRERREEAIRVLRRANDSAPRVRPHPPAGPSELELHGRYGPTNDGARKARERTILTDLDGNHIEPSPELREQLREEGREI